MTKPKPIRGDHRTGLSEADWQDQLLDYARLTRWLVHHCRPARKQDGTWTTPIQGDKGFPDLVLVRGGRVLFVEVKKDGETVNGHQRIWRDRLLLAGMEWQCWRPKDWDHVKATLAPAKHSSWQLTEDVDAGDRV